MTAHALVMAPELEAPGVWLYQLTDKGLALELTGKGTKYCRDGDLN